jgi:hypothetical protein
MSRSVLDGRFVYIRNFRPELPLVYRNKYRERIEMARTLIEMDQKGELHGDAAYIFMKAKPVEELYDLATDPDEVRNLAGKPEYQEKLKEYRQALSQWQIRIGDKGFVPELDLVEMMWPGLVQPETAVVEFKPDKKKANLALTCKTPGASIAYQQGDEIGKPHWNLYTKSIQLKEGEKFAARAVRIGYKTSEIRLFENF